MKGADDIHKFLDYGYSVNLMKKLIEEETNKFINVYENI